MSCPMPSFSYDVPGFSSFYSSMVQSLPPEYEVGLNKQVLEQLVGACRAAFKAQGGGKACIRVLDLATGSGQMVGDLVGKLGEDVEVVGVDISEEMLQEARKKLPQGRWIREDMENLVPELVGWADVVCCAAGSVHHAKDVKKWAENVQRYLKPGGWGLANVFGTDEFKEDGVSGGVLQLGEWKRVHLFRKVEGGIVKDRFALEREVGGEVVMRVEEGWDLRCISADELKQALKGEGLVVVAEAGTWAGLKEVVERVVEVCVGEGVEGGAELTSNVGAIDGPRVLLFKKPLNAV